MHCRPPQGRASMPRSHAGLQTELRGQTGQHAAFKLICQGAKFVLAALSFREFFFVPAHSLSAHRADSMTQLINGASADD